MKMVYGTVTLQAIREEESFHLSRIDEKVKGWGFHDLTQEQVWVVAFDPTLMVRAVVPVAQGNQFYVEVDMAAVLTAVLATGTNRFWVMHNHCNRNVTPTKRDLELTQQINVAAAICGMYLEDHIIIGRGDRWYSMVDHGDLTPSKGIAKIAAMSAHSRVWTLPHKGRR
jgi:DNA repair protein RadC